jgi:hypothetical protein
MQLHQNTGLRIKRVIIPLLGGLMLAAGTAQVSMSAMPRLTVNIIDNENKARLGRIPPKKVHEIDVRKRVIETDKVPFIPTKRAIAG